jgi:hypothetical protein
MRFSNITRIVPVLAVIVAFGIGPPALADSFFKQVVHTDAFEMMGQTTPETNDTTTMWLTEGKAYSSMGDTAAVIFYLQKGEICFINHQEKQYTLMPMDLREIMDEVLEEEGEDEEARQMAEVVKGMAGAIMGSTRITVTPTEETKKIGEWDCTKYNVDLTMAMMTSKQELWATEDIKVDYTMFQAASGGMMAQMPGYDRILEGMKQIKGVPVKTVATASIMGSEAVTTTELIEYAEKDAPDGIYDIPEGYKKVELGMEMDAD